MAAHPLYLAALAADEAFSRELTRVYGARACDARYLARHSDADVTRAKDSKLRADEAWRAAMAQTRNGA